MKYHTFRKKLENAGIINKPKKLFTAPELEVIRWAKSLGESASRFGRFMELQAPDCIIEKEGEMLKERLNELMQSLYVHKKIESEKVFTVGGKDVIVAERLYRKYLKKKG
jgi:hypothetical protein